MSYINDALRKAQKERDGRYSRFGEIIGTCSTGPRRSRKRTWVIGAGGALLVLAAGGLLWTWVVPRALSLGGPDALPQAAPGRPATPARAAPLAAAQATVVPAEAAAEKRPVSGALAMPVPEEVLKEAEERYEEALAAQRGGDFKRAEALYQKVLMLDPGHLRALNNLGVLCMAQRKQAWAVALFSRAIILKRDYVDPHYNLACLYARARRVDESLRHLKAAMAIDGAVKDWVMKDADLKNVVASPGFKKLMEGQ